MNGRKFFFATWHFFKRKTNFTLTIYKTSLNVLEFKQSDVARKSIIQYCGEFISSETGERNRKNVAKIKICSNCRTEFLKSHFFYFMQVDETMADNILYAKEGTSQNKK